MCRYCSNCYPMERLAYADMCNWCAVATNSKLANGENMKGTSQYSGRRVGGAVAPSNCGTIRSGMVGMQSNIIVVVPLKILPRNKISIKKNTFSRGERRLRQPCHASRALPQCALLHVVATSSSPNCSPSHSFFKL